MQKIIDKLIVIRKQYTRLQIAIHKMQKNKTSRPEETFAKHNNNNKYINLECLTQNSSTFAKHMRPNMFLLGILKGRGIRFQNNAHKTFK